MKWNIWTPEIGQLARRTATVAAYGGGGLTALGTAAYGLLLAEGALARRIVGRPHGTDGPYSDGIYGVHPGEPIRMVMLGDSTSVGLGMTDPARTPAVLLARGLAATARRPVRLSVLGASGAASADLAGQVDRALPQAPELAVIFIGANDVVTSTPPGRAVRHLAEAVRRLRAAGAEVVVGTCPDLGTVRPIPQPLRWVMRQWSRRLAAAQTVAVVAAGGRTVSFADVLGPEFHADPARMFGPDRYHPSARGYLRAAHIVLPSVCTALGYGTSRPADAVQDRNAAALAAREPGIEVTAPGADGRADGRRGRWTALLRRRTGALPEGV